MTTLSASTTKAYTQRIARIESGLKVAGRHLYLQSVEDAEYTVRFLNESDKTANPETRKGYLSALLWKCKTSNASPEVLAVFQAAFDKTKQDCNKRARQQELPDNRKADYLKKRELLEAYEKMERATQDWEIQRDGLLLAALYILQPPVRADYWNMLIIDDRKVIQDGHNYCLLNNQEQKFIFQVYKTAKTYGKQEIQIESERLIHLLQAQQKWGSPTTEIDGKEYPWVLPYESPQLLCYRVQQLFRRFTGKNCSIGLIRHAWVYDFYERNPTLLEKEALARKMLHSVAVQELYRTNEGVRASELDEQQED